MLALLVALDIITSSFVVTLGAKFPVFWYPLFLCILRMFGPVVSIQVFSLRCSRTTGLANEWFRVVLNMFSTIRKLYLTGNIGNHNLREFKFLGKLLPTILVLA